MPYLQFADAPLDLHFLKNEVRAFYLAFSWLCLLYALASLLAGVAGPMVYLPITPTPPWGDSLAACSLPCGGLASADVVGPACDWGWLARHNYTRPSLRSSSLGACAANSGGRAPPTAYVTALLTAILPLLGVFAGCAGAYFARAQAALMAELGSAAGGSGGVRARLSAAAFAVARGPRVPAPERRAWVVGLHLVEDAAWPRHAARLWAALALPPPLACALAALRLLGEAPRGAALGAGFAFAALAAPLAGGGAALERALRERAARALAHPDTPRDPEAAAAMTRWMGLGDGGALFADMARPPAAAAQRAPRVARSGSLREGSGGGGGGGAAESEGRPQGRDGEGAAGGGGAAV